MFLVGCDYPERPPLAENQVDDAGRRQTNGDHEAKAQIPLEMPGIVLDEDWDTWDAYFVNHRQVGYVHSRATILGPRDSSEVRYELDSHLYLEQGGVGYLQRISQVSRETRDGHLLGFEGVLGIGPAITQFLGEFSEIDPREELRVQTVRGGSHAVRKVSWQPEVWGLFALEQTLRQRPMLHKGEERRLKMLLPGSYELATARLRCLGMASVPLLDGKPHQLIEVECEVQSENGKSNESTIWTDPSGEMARMHLPAADLMAYRADQQTATNIPKNDQVLAAIAVSGEIKDPSQATVVGYEIHPTVAATRAGLLPDIQPAPGQYVAQNEDGRLRIIVSRRGDKSGERQLEREILARGYSSYNAEPSDADRAASAYVDFSHGEIHKFRTLTITNDEWKPMRVALELTRAVHQNVSEPSKVNVLAKASAVAKYWIGNQTERAIFLAALLRSSGIPARIALGLKYSQGSPNRLIFHSWTLAHVDGAWVHLDPSEGGLAAADRVVFSMSDLSVGDEYAMLSSLLDTLRAIKIKVSAMN